MLIVTLAPDSNANTNPVLESSAGVSVREPFVRATVTKLPSLAALAVVAT